MRKNSKTTLLFNDPEFQQYLRDRFSINLDGQLCGRHGKRVSGTDAGIGYRIINTYFKGENRCVLVHRIVMFLHLGRVPGEIDHIDGDRGNNNLFNLREMDHSKNMGRIPKQLKPASKSKFKGVSRSSKNRWCARIAETYIGNYDREEDAAKAYDKAAYKHFGPTAWLNFPSTPRPTV